MPHEMDLLKAFMTRIPGIEPRMGSGDNGNGLWWIKFQIDIEHPLAWRVVQELGNIVNYISTTELLSTKFFPVSPPVYLNGGPKDFLSWVIENQDPEFSPAKLVEWLEGRMPRPVDDLGQWTLEE